MQVGIVTNVVRPCQAQKLLCKLDVVSDVDPSQDSWLDQSPGLESADCIDGLFHQSDIMVGDSCMASRVYSGKSYIHYVIFNVAIACVNINKHRSEHVVNVQAGRSCLTCSPRFCSNFLPNWLPSLNCPEPETKETLMALQYWRLGILAHDLEEIVCW